MLFHEIYGCYYNAVAKMLDHAVDGTLTADKMKQIADEKAFAESFLTIIPAFENEDWQLLDAQFGTPLRHKHSTSITVLQKRWLKAISLDPRIRLFGVTSEGIENIKPLFTPDDYVIFDRYADGDPYEDENYIRIFRKILNAIRENKKIRIKYESSKGNTRTILCTPCQFEYSEKDDKFRLLINNCRYAEIINVGRIKNCEVVEEKGTGKNPRNRRAREYFVMELLDDRNALERAMLHFAHFEKEAERISDNRYRMKINYDKDDVTEMVIRVLSFGPFVKVTEPEKFVDLIKERLLLQKSCGL